MKAECLECQDTSILQKEKIDIHEQISTNSIYHKSDDRFVEKYGEEESPDLLCEYDSVSSFICPPKYDQYDDDYVPQIQINLTEESEAILGERNVQIQQLESSDQLVHFSYEEEEESVENFETSEGTLPFCFESFQFIRDNYHAIRNQVSTSFVIDHLEDNQIFAQYSSPLVLQPLNATEYQIVDEDLEVATYDQKIQVDSLLLCFESSELFKEKEEQHVQICQILSEPMRNKLQVSFHVLYNPSADRLNDRRNQNSSPVAGCKGQDQDDSDFPILRHEGYPKHLYNYLIQLNNCVYILQDPFVQFLDLAKEIGNFLIFSQVNTAISDCKISILSTNKHKKQRSLMYIMLKWLHQLFHFT